MNRPIVFRARHRESRLWFIGYAFFERAEHDDELGQWVELPALIHTSCSNADDFPSFNLLDPNTLGQWTGCRDSNGRMVFEGDVVEFAEGHTCSVRYLDNKARFDCAGRAITDWDKITVVGNIHDDRSGEEGAGDGA